MTRNITLTQRCIQKVTQVRILYLTGSSKICELYSAGDVKKRSGRRLAGHPADFVNTLPAKLGTLRFFPPRPNSVLYAFFRPGQSLLNFFVSGGQSTPITLFYVLDGHRISERRKIKNISLISKQEYQNLQRLKKRHQNLITQDIHKK